MLAEALQPGLIAWALLLLPSAALLALLRRCGGHSREGLALAWVLGPWLWTGTAAIIRLAGGSLLVAAVTPTLLAILGVVVGGRILLRTPWRDAVRPGVLWSIAASLVLLGAFFLLRGGETRLWDSTFNAHIATFLRQAPLPPENPFLAGESLAYPWFMNLEVALIQSLAGGTPWQLFPILDLHAIVGMLLALSLCLSTMRTRWGVALALFLAVWAPNSLAWLFHVVRWTLGDVTGIAAVRESARDFNAVMSQMAPGYAGNLAFPVHKLFEGTPFAIAFPLPFLAIYWTGRTLNRCRFECGIPLMLVTVYWLQIHYMSAILGVTVIVSAAVLYAVVRRKRGGRAVGLVAGAVAVGVFLALPYLWMTIRTSILHGASRGLAILPNPGSLVAVASFAVPYAVVAWLGRAPSNDDGGGPKSNAEIPERWVLACAVAFLGCGTMLWLADHNEEKVLMVGAFLVPLLAGPALERALRFQAAPPRRLRALATGAFLLLALVGVLIITALGSAYRPEPERYRADPAMAAALATRAPRDAILVSDLYAPADLRWPGYLYYPSLAGLWGLIDELRRREGVILALKGKPSRRPDGIAPLRERTWPTPISYSPEEALAEVASLQRPVVFLVPRDQWPGLPRTRMRQLASGLDWEILLLER